MSLILKLATIDDTDTIVELVRLYHALEAIEFREQATTEALRPLLQHGDAGGIWLIELAGSTIGYIALCFGYSIELGGRDAFIDELFILEEHRGRGVGKTVLEDIQSKAREMKVKALHLEVERSNDRARKLYRSLGFASRERFHLMTCTL